MYMEEELILNPETDLVFYEKDNQIFGGGYKMKLCAAQNLERYYPPPTAKSTSVK